MTEANQSWPEWLISCNPTMIQHLECIDNIAIRIISEAREGYEYSYPFNKPLNEAMERIVRESGLTKGQDGKYENAKSAKLKTNLPLSVTSGLICKNAATYQILGAYVAADKIAIAKFLRSIKDVLLKDDMLLPLISMRCIVEHVSHLNKIVKDIRSLQEYSSFNEANVELQRLYAIVGSKAYATRVDWFSLLEKPANAIEKDSLKYTPCENRLDLTAQGLMNSIDHLNKDVQGSRQLYEILCEFAHPNVGNLLSSNETADPVTDKMGILWVHKKLSLNPPIGFVQAVPHVILFIFEHLSNVLQHYENNLKEIESLRERILKITQVVIRGLIFQYKDKIDPYWNCPCGSGNKIRFCCLAKNHTH